MKKRAALLLSVVSVLCLLAGCGGSHDDSSISSNIAPLGFPLDTYHPTGIIYYMSPMSWTPEYYLEKNKDTVYVLKPDQFWVGYQFAPTDLFTGTKYENVTYLEEELGDKIATGKMGNKDVDISQAVEKQAYKIFSNSEDTNFRIYCIDGELWIGESSFMGESREWYMRNILKLEVYQE